MQHDKEIYMRGLNCPLPILRAKTAFSGVQSGANGESAFFMRKK